MSKPWIADFELDIDLARELIASQFPSLAPVRIEPFGEGWDNYVFVVNSDLVFRFPRRDVAAPLIEREARLLPLIGARVSLPVPSPIYIGRPSADYPWSFAGFRLLPGRTASDAGLSEDQRSAIAEPLARFLLSLHSIDVRDAERFGARGDDLHRVDMSRRVPAARELLREIRHGLPIEVSKLERVLNEAPLAYQPSEDTLVHGDLYARQMLVDDRGSLSGVIDWGDCHIGDRAADLMAAFTLFSRETRTAFFDAYGPVREEEYFAARTRGLQHTLNVFRYAEHIGDKPLRNEAIVALQNLTA